MLHWIEVGRQRRPAENSFDFSFKFCRERHIF
jgi:hypothetical protein